MIKLEILCLDINDKILFIKTSIFRNVAIIVFICKLIAFHFYMRKESWTLTIKHIDLGAIKKSYTINTHELELNE